MKSYVLFLSCSVVLLIGCDAPLSNPIDQGGAMLKPFQHLSYLLNLKDAVATQHWPAFAEEVLFSPIVYYTHTGTFILNPNEHIRSITAYEDMPSFQGMIPVIRLADRYIDTTNFQFASSYSDTDSAALYFQENILAFQSFELTQKFIPDISDIQDWSIMVIHELFHSYQRSMPAHKSYYTHLEIPGGSDEFLGTYHRDLDWYRASIQEENELLKEVWIDGADLVENLELYNSLRNNRINRIQQEFGVDIREVEDYEIMIEGQARYFESLCKRYLGTNSTPKTMLAEEDQSLITGLFEEYDVKKDRALYDLYNDRYYYQLGYNISMILEQYLPEYQSTIYQEHQRFDPYLSELMTRE